MTNKTYQNLIGGQWIGAASGKTFLNLNPADHDDIVGAFPQSGAEDVDRAVAAAKLLLPPGALCPLPSARRSSCVPESCCSSARNSTRTT